MKTRTDLIYRALYNLGVTPSGQNPADEEFNAVNALVDGVVENLWKRDIYFLQDVDVIPDAEFIHFGHILAWAAAPEFGMQADAAIAAKAQRAEQDLSEIDRNSIRYLHMRTMHTDYPV